jgi:hypothetical protein
MLVQCVILQAMDKKVSPTSLRISDVLIQFFYFQACMHVLVV